MLIIDDTDNASYCDEFLKAITGKFKMEVTENIYSFLCTTLTRTPEGITVHTTKNIL